MIRVCDALMGSGKTQSTIAYINEHPEKRFIYITPYLDETRRIRDACPAADFVEPSDRIKKYNFRKSDHIVGLIKEGRNIASTHGLFIRLNEDMLKDVAMWHYELIIDEAVDVIRSCNLDRGDYDHIIQSGWIDNDGTRNVDQVPLYEGARFRDIYELIKNGNLIDADKKGAMYYWILTPNVIKAFEDILVLTYMFDVQILKYYFDLNGIDYGKIGIEHPDADTYRFVDDGGYVPDYVSTLHKKIHIFDNQKLNDIGDHYFSLSSSWFENSSRYRKKIERLRKNVANYFLNYMKDHSSDERLWSIFGKCNRILRCKGFMNNDLAFNSKATNDYRTRRVLAYCVNIFMNPFEKNYLISQGIDVDEDGAALSTMIQWIWRSAIRDGHEIWIYIPSRRMRELLINWIQQVEKEYVAYQRKKNGGE